MTFKYFDKPEIFVGLREGKTLCDICGREEFCFDAQVFYGAERITSICPSCLKNGELYDRDTFTCVGDIEELKRQLKGISPLLNDLEIERIAREKTQELEKTTPHLTTWQDWDWPCSDGDYCKFIAYGSKPLYNALATGTNAEELFKNSFYYNQTASSNIDYLWKDILPETEIKNFNDSNKFTALFYVFKSLNSDKIITLWDC